MNQSSTNHDSLKPPRIAVVGGGISGLAAAHRITELLPRAELSLFESSGRLGGVLETIRRDGFLVERSADSFITKLPWAVDLCRRLGLAEELLPTDEKRRRACVIREGRVLAVPEGFVLMRPGKWWPLVTTPTLSWSGKLRLLAELFVPRRHAEDTGDESVASFATRRLGREAFERLVQPLVAGIYTADPERLSMAATLPEFLAMEREHGSLSRGRRNAVSTNESGARYGLFVAPRGGMQSLVEAIAKRLPEETVRLNTPVSNLKYDNQSWHLELGDPTSSIQHLVFDAVIVALPSHAAARLFTDTNPGLSAKLADIECAGCAVVSAVYRREQLARPTQGFGFVVPRIEGRSIIAASYASEKFPERAPENSLVIRTFVGGALQPGLLDRSDGDLRQLAHDELATVLAITGQPLWTDVARWPRSMPQYHVGHLGRVAEIENSVGELPGLELAGNAYHGVGLPQCIRSGELAAERVSEWFKKQQPVNAPSGAE